MSDFEPMNAGKPTPAVDSADIRRVWTFMGKARAAAGQDKQQEAAEQPSSIGFSPESLAQECSPGADIFAVWLRTAILELLSQQGLLNSWLQDGELDERVFGVVASFPIAGIEQFNPDEFLEELRSETGLR
jgi:hypothetical protein